MTTYLDAIGAVREWINSLTTTLVGVGNPLQLGAVLNQREGAADVPYCWIFELPASTWGGAENSSMRARISAQVYGPTKESACDAAVAYAEAVQQLVYGNRAVLSGGRVIVGADFVEGPRWSPDGDEPRYIVDSDYLFA